MAEWLRSQRLWRNIVTGEVSSDYRLLLTTECLTLEADYVKRPRSRDLRTLFREVELVPLYEALTNEEIELLDTAPARDLPVEELAEVVAEVVGEGWSLTEQSRAWSRDKFHLVSHSSGFDSRILSGTLRRLYHERGDGWLGEVLFFCREWETECFEAIMRHEGWRPDQWAIVDPEVEPGEWHAPHLDFATAWQWHNGMAKSTLAWWLYPLRRLQLAGLVPDDDERIQLWTGLGDMRFVNAWTGRLHEEMDRYYYRSEAAGMVEPTETRHLFHSFRLICQAARQREPRRRRLTLLRAVDPELAELPRCSDLLGYRTLSRRLYEKVNADYDSSWFGRRVWPDVQRTRQAHLKAFWRAYTAASLCEHLRERGVEINV